MQYLCVVNKTIGPVILFDGVCNLCNGSVQFIIRKDTKSRFYFSSLQGRTGQELLQQFHLPATDFNSFVLVEGDKVYTESTAVLRVFKLLGGAWSVLFAGIIIPRFIRDAMYRLIAKNRYKWFGKREHCMLPTPALKKRFLD
ncbi:MAG TPA: thiol-disulfide oxidoreductase DCC family protein [Agriterribacter sp.]|nr:thiol-disulfide oxidoreductase DCC family protein [Agriterribacter sp.]